MRARREVTPASPTTTLKRPSSWPTTSRIGTPRTPTIADPVFTVTRQVRQQCSSLACDLAELCIDSVSMSGAAAASAGRLSAGGPSDVSAWPDSCLPVAACASWCGGRSSPVAWPFPFLCGCGIVTLAGAQNSTAACTDCDQPSGRARSAHRTDWLIQSSNIWLQSHSLRS